MNTVENIEHAEIRDKYFEDLRQAQLMNAGIETIPQYLGPLMAEREWNDSVDEANKKFVNVEAYDLFCDQSALILVGRTGTGKSSLLKKLEYEVNSNRIAAYEDVVIISLTSYILQLSNYGQLDGTARTYAELEENIKKFIMLSIMKHVVFVSERQYSDSELKPIKAFLKDVGINDATNLGNILDIYAGKMSNGTVNDVIQTVNLFTEVTKRLFSSNYYDAEDALKMIFEKKKMLVLVDTMEDYDFNDLDSIVIVKTLMNYTFKCFSEDSFISIKIALPSELYSALRGQIPAKQIGNTVFIEWKYRDLVKFIAMRCFYLVTESKWAHIFNCSIDGRLYDNISNDYYEAKRFLLNFLPETCSASINLSFDTLSYIIRHTQKKPRQLMVVFESIMHRVIVSGNINYYKMHEKELKKQIHYVQETLISDSLNMYSNTYPGIGEICARILSNRKYTMTDNELDDYIRNADLGTDKVSKNVIKRILIESGIIGTVDDSNIHFVNRNNSWFKNPNVIKIVPALYEYQVKGRLIYNEKSTYVVHPMCYEYYHSLIDFNCLVYPESYDDTDETFMYLSQMDKHN